MAKLYIGNCSRQVLDFRYRMPGSEGPGSMGQLMMQKIQPGTQTAIPGDLDPTQIEHILKQHAKYGIIESNAADRTRAFHGTCYSVDRPITAQRLLYLMQGNLGQLVKEGEQIRRVNAVAQNNLINEALTQAGGRQLDVLELTVQQEQEDPKNDVAQMSEGILVSGDAAARPPSGRGSRKAA